MAAVASEHDPAEPAADAWSGARPERRVAVRPVTTGDWWWLTRAGLAPEMAGVQYHWLELPLQLYIAPARGTAIRPGPRCIIEVDGRRAGYIGRSPLSGNLEYFLQPWARGGTGTRAIAEFLRTGRPGDRSRSFFVSRKNARSRTALDRAFAALGWREGEAYTTRDVRMGQMVTVGGGPSPDATDRGGDPPPHPQNGA